MSDKKLTWRELRDAANELPESCLDKTVMTWYLDREGGESVVEILPLEEDYYDTGDNTVAPESEMIQVDEWVKDPSDLVYPKGMKILVIKHPDHED